MGNLFKKYKSRLMNNGRKFLSAVDFFEMNLYKKELQNFNPLTNTGNEPSSGPTEQTIYSEPFGLNGLIGFPYYNRPSGWTLDENTGADAVFYGDSDVLPFCGLPGSSGTIYFAWSDGTVLRNSIYTQAISTVGKTSIKIDFNQYRTTGCNLTTLEWSNNGTVWNATTFTNVTDNNTWIAISTVTLPVGAENLATLYIRFGYTAANNGYITGIDDFTVKATF